MTIRSAGTTPIASLLNPVQMLRQLWKHRELIWKFAARDVQEVHRGTYLGVAWVIAQPLLILCVYTFVFSFVLGGREWMGEDDVIEGTGKHAGFAMMFFCGHSIYHFFQECANRAPQLLVQRSNLVQRVVFPLEILSVAIAGSALVYTLIGLGLLVAAAGVLAGVFSKTIFLLPVVLAPLLMLSLGVSWVLSSLGVFVRDTRAVTLVSTQLLYFMTPIFYTVSIVPEQYRWVIQLNPLTPIVESSRAVVLMGKMPDWSSLAIVTLLSFVVLQIGYAWFMRSRRVFSDVL